MAVTLDKGQRLWRLFTSACLSAISFTFVIAWTQVPASARWGGCCGLAGFCLALRTPQVVCVVDPNCGEGEWCCWGNPQCNS